MANVRELLARLNPQTIRYDVGSGGNWADKLSNQDIAAALAFVPAGLGREVLIACWWPDGAMLSRHKLRDAVFALVGPELRRQTMMLSDARTDVGITEAIIGWSGAASAPVRAERDRAKARLEKVAAQCWPRNIMQNLPALAAAVIDEIASAHKCPNCQGRRNIVHEGLVKSCGTCGGTGLDPDADLRRAKALQTDSRNFVRHWKPVYQWLLLRFSDAEQEAAKHLFAALRKEEVEP